MDTAANPISKIAKPIGFLSLAGTILPPFLFMMHWLASGPMQIIMLISCVTWFSAAPFWMKTE